MPRKRMIDPSIWTDEGMTALTPRQQLLYIGLFSNADDEGRLRGSPKALRMIMPTIYARLKDEAIQADLKAVLHEMRCLVSYVVDDRQYLMFKNYVKWQRIDRPTPSALPLNGPFDESSPNARGALDPSIGEVSLVEVRLGEESVGARKTRTPRTYEPIDDEFRESMRAKYEAVFGSDLYALKVRQCIQHAEEKHVKDRRLYLENWLASDAQRLASNGRTNGHAAQPNFNQDDRNGHLYDDVLVEAQEHQRRVLAEMDAEEAAKEEARRAEV